MTSYKAARDAIARTVRRVFPDATPVAGWAGVEAWGAPRPRALVGERAPGTYDPAFTVIGIADRKAGPTVYFLDPGDYFALDTHRALLEAAGFKLGRGCIYHTRAAPLPVAPLEALFRRVKARDAAAARTKRVSAKPSATRADGGAGPVDAYLARLPADQRAALEKLRKQVHSAAPGATEKIAYGIPTFVLGGRNLVHMAAFKEHCSFYPGAAGVALALKGDLTGHKLAKGTIQFTPAKPIPAALVRRIVKMRVADVAASAKKTARRPRARG